MKRSLLLFSLLPVMTFAGSYRTSAAEPLTTSDSSNTDDDRNPANRAAGPTNPSGNTRATEGGNIFVTGEALYWIASEHGLSPYTLAGVTNNQNSLNPVRSANERVKNLHFKWDWGFRVGLGLDIPHDEWDLFFDWTRFHTHAKKRTALPFSPGSTLDSTFSGKVILPSWSLPGDNLPALSNNSPYRVLALAAKWKLHLNLFDLNLGRKFFVGKWLTLRPNGGVRGAIINQRYKIAYTAFNVNNEGNVFNVADAVKMSNDFRAIGLLGGLDAQWGLFDEFSIYGNAAISLLYGRFHVNQKEAAASSSPTLGSSEADAIQKREHFHNLKAITDLAVGLQWDHFFADGALHLGLHVGWEHHLFFGQNQFVKYVANTAFTTDQPQAYGLASNQDLTLQGGVAGIRFDF